VNLGSRGGRFGRDRAATDFDSRNFAAGIKVLKGPERTGQMRRCTVASEGTSGQQTSQFTAQESVSIILMPRRGPGMQVLR